MASAAMLRCMRELDAAGARLLWAQVAPRMPQPKSDADALTMLHHARTQSAAMGIKERAYSHRWLTDRGIPSGLPDELKPRAERLYPQAEEAVGISVNAKSALFRPIVALVHNAMSDAVLECYADGHRDAATIKPRMAEARQKTVRKLLGV